MTDDNPAEATEGRRRDVRRPFAMDGVVPVVDLSVDANVDAGVDHFKWECLKPGRP